MKNKSKLKPFKVVDFLIKMCTALNLEATINNFSHFSILKQI